MKIGFVTGRIGPNMHISAMIFTAISKISYFKEMRRDSVLRVQSLIIGAALGLSCSFGTPFTGDFFYYICFAYEYFLKVWWSLLK